MLNDEEIPNLVSQIYIESHFTTFMLNTAEDRIIPRRLILDIFSHSKKWVKFFLLEF